MCDGSIPFLSESKHGIRQDLGQKIRTKRQGSCIGTTPRSLVALACWTDLYRIGRCPRAVARLVGAMVSPPRPLSKPPRRRHGLVRLAVRLAQRTDSPRLLVRGSPAEERSVCSLLNFALASALVEMVPCRVLDQGLVPTANSKTRVFLFP